MTGSWIILGCAFACAYIILRKTNDRGKQSNDDGFLEVTEQDVELIQKRCESNIEPVVKKENLYKTESKPIPRLVREPNNPTNEPNVVIEKKVTNTVGAEIYRDAKRLFMFLLKCAVVIILMLIAYVSYNEHQKEERYKARQAEYEKQQVLAEQQREKLKQAELARRIDLPISWYGSDKWRENMRSWGNSGFVFTSKQFILNIDSAKLTRVQKAMLQGKAFNCSLKLFIGDYEETFADSFFKLGPYADGNNSQITNDMFLHVQLNTSDADKKARNFEKWQLICGDLFSEVNYQ